MIDQLIAALNQEINLSAEEIADTLWLAMHMEKSGVDSTSRKSRKSKPNLEITEDNSNKRSQQDSSNKSETKTPASQPESPEKQEEENKAGLYNQKPDKSQKSLEIPFKVPDAPSLREQLDLARALKPLMRHIPSGSTLVLDEAATTQRIADEGIWLPVLQPTLEPWLDLELVVDEGISMQIWRHTIKELERLLKNYGIFRDVRVWGLINNEQNKIQIRRGIGAIAKYQSPHSAAELIDSSGRRLVLVVSDCVSVLWRSGAVNSALKTWANNVPTAIIQMLPQWLWGRTALGRATEVRLQGLAPSVSNRQLIATTISLWSEIDEATGIKVPVLTLESELVANWAQMLLGKGSIQSSGFVFKPEIRNLDRNKPLFNFNRGELTAEQRVQAFRVTSSPMARKLAGLLASAPVISLPVIRLIRETMLKDSQQVHVAEVFLGGLLKPLSDVEFDTDPDYVQYGFIDGVRELLVDSVPTNSVLNVVEEVSRFVAKRVGLSLEAFAAVLRNPEEISDSRVVEQVQPFAMITAQILRRLGGKYVKVADEIQPKKLNIDYLDEFNLLHNIIFTFTPKDEVIKLPKDSTPVDFAYSVHTEVGHMCFEAKVNNKKVDLNYKLQTGDTVEIVKRKTANPQIEWLKFVKTKPAKKQIRRWHRQNKVNQGWECIRNSFGHNIQTYKTQLKYASSQIPGCKSLNDLAYKIGSKDCTIGEVTMFMEHFRQEFPRFSHPQGDHTINQTHSGSGDNIARHKNINESRNISILSNFTVNASGAGAFNLGDISGTVANTINQLPSFDNEPHKKELKELLTQLQTAVLETDLDDEEQAETLEQIQAIAQAIQNPQDAAVKRIANKAMKVLRGIAAILPPTASMVTICNQLPKLISKIFVG